MVSIRAPLASTLERTRMLHAWSTALANRKVRAALLAVAVLATVAFGPMSAFGAYVLFAGLLARNSDFAHVIVWGMLGTVGLIGIAGAWVRLLVPRARFQASPLFKWATAAALAVGMLVAALYFSEVLRNPTELMTWGMLPIMAVGLFLLGATIGEVSGRRGQ